MFIKLYNMFMKLNYLPSSLTDIVYITYMCLLCNVSIALMKLHLTFPSCILALICTEYYLGFDIFATFKNAYISGTFDSWNKWVSLGALGSYISDTESASAYHI